MRIDPEYNTYYVYSAVYHIGKQITFGACPVVWVDKVVFQGGHWKMGLTWADGNYHLYDDSGLSNLDAQFFEECIYTSLNESEEAYGEIALSGTGYEVRWCLIEEEQMRVVMDIPDPPDISNILAQCVKVNAL